jgi:hypothetical protein
MQTNEKFAIKIIDKAKVLSEENGETTLERVSSSSPAK